MPLRENFPSQLFFNTRENEGHKSAQKFCPIVLGVLKCA